MVGTRVKHRLIINNSPNSNLFNSRDTGPLLEIFLLEEGGSRICESAVASGERFCTFIYGYATLHHILGQ